MPGGEARGPGVNRRWRAWMRPARRPVVHPEYAPGARNITDDLAASGGHYRPGRKGKKGQEEGSNRLINKAVPAAARRAAGIREIFFTKPLDKPRANPYHNRAFNYHSDNRYWLK